MRDGAPADDDSFLAGMDTILGKEEQPADDDADDSPSSGDEGDEKDDADDATDDSDDDDADDDDADDVDDEDDQDEESDDEDEDDGEEDEDGEKAAKAKKDADVDDDDDEERDFYSQTPAEKRRQAFNDTKRHSNAQRRAIEAKDRENAELKAQLEKLKTPADDQPAEVPPLDKWVEAALTSQDEKVLTQGQRALRTVDYKLETRLKTIVEPAKAAYEEAAKVTAKAQKAHDEQMAVVAHYEGLAKTDGEGFHNEQIERERTKLDRLKTELTRAETSEDRTKAKLDRAEGDYKAEFGRARELARDSHQAELRARKEAEDKRNQENKSKAEREAIDTEYFAAQKAIRKELGIKDKEAWGDMKDLIHRRMQRFTDGGGVVKKGGIKAKMLELVQGFAKRAAGTTVAARANARDRIAAQPGGGKSSKEKAQPRGHKSHKENLAKIERELAGAFNETRGRSFSRSA